MEGSEHVPTGSVEAPKRGDIRSEKIGEDLPEGDFDIPSKMEYAGESASEDWSGFTQAKQFIQAIRSEEAKQHQKEEELASFLRVYIQQAGDDPIIDLVLQLVDRNVLATLLIAVLTLRDQSLTERLVKQLGSPTLAAAHGSDAATVSKEISVQFGATPWDERVRPAIGTWLFTMREICSTYPKRLIKDLTYENRDADQLFGTLLKEVLIDFLKRNKIVPNEQVIHRFSEGIVERLVRQMADQIANQKELR